MQLLSIELNGKLKLNSLLDLFISSSFFFFVACELRLYKMHQEMPGWVHIAIDCTFYEQTCHLKPVLHTYLKNIQVALLRSEMLLLILELTSVCGLFVVLQSQAWNCGLVPPEACHFSVVIWRLVPSSPCALPADWHLVVDTKWTKRAVFNLVVNVGGGFVGIIPGLQLKFTWKIIINMFRRGYVY